MPAVGSQRETEHAAAHAHRLHRARRHGRRHGREPAARGLRRSPASTSGRRRSTSWSSSGGQAAASPRAAAEGAAVLILMVVNDAQVEAVLFGADGALETLPEGGHDRALEHGAGRLCARPRRAPGGARPAPARCAGERRRDRRRGRPAHDHGLGPERGVRGRRPGARGLLEEGLPARRPARDRLDGQGGQPAAGRRQPRDRGRRHGVRGGAGRRSQGALRGDPRRCRRQLDVREPGAAHAGGRLHARPVRSTSGSRTWASCSTPARR